MGIAYLLRGYLDQEYLWLLYFITLHAIGIAYFWKLHPLIFKKGPAGGRAVFLSLIGMGFGQAYNRQVVKGVIFAAIIPLIYVIRNSEVITAYKSQFQIGFLIILALCFIDAGVSAASAKRRVAKLNRNKEVMNKVELIKKYQANDHEFAVDTNIMMHEPDLLVYLLEKESFTLNMSMVVFNELDGLKNNESRITRQQAQLAFDIIEEYQRQGKLKMLKAPRTEEIRKYGLSGSPDEKIIGTYLKEQHNGMPNLLFLSNDKGARIIARNVGMPVAEI